MEVERGFHIVMGCDVQASDRSRMLNVPSYSVTFVHRHLRAIPQIPRLRQVIRVSMTYHGIRGEELGIYLQRNQSEPDHWLVGSGDVVFKPPFAERLAENVEVFLKWT